MRKCVVLVLIGLAALTGVPSEANADPLAAPSTAPSSAQDPVDLLWRTDPKPAEPPTGVRSAVGLRLGSDHRGDLTVAGKGQVFAPLGRRSALQVEASYDWYHDSHEGQIDVGLISRVRNVQLGLFSSVRYVNLGAFEHGRSLSQFGGTLDHVFATGRVGLYATAGLEDTALLGRRLLGRYVYEEALLRLVDQAGVSWQVDAGRVQYGGHVAVLKPAGRGHTTGGSVRAAFPVSEGWALTAEGAWNASAVAPTTHGRFTVGIRMGDWPSARASSASARPAPIEIPAIRYHVVTRQVRDGNDAPFADAGPDQVIVPECAESGPCVVTVKLDAAGSIDPDGDPITYRWVPRSGFSNGQFPTPANESWVMFLGEEDRTYVVRLFVTDNRGAMSIDDVTITITKRR